MSRYEIEDILSQNKRGIIFRAHDSEKGLTVALRRFFPFGQDGGGLMEEETDAFRIATQRLADLSHPALRSIFSGAVDPIDNMPYIVVEWIDGEKLGDVLNGETLDPKLVTQVLQLALEVSQSLSEILGEEAVWVETDVDSIFVGSEESGRGFVFWLSPFKWLGAESGSRKLGALVDLGEHLAGWKGKLIGDHAGQGLGGWLKWMKNNPDASLAQALETLPSFTSDGDSPPPPPEPTFLAPVAAHPVVKLKQPSSIPPVMIAVCVGLVLAVGVLAYYRLTAKAPDVPTLYAEQTISPAQLEPTPGKSTAIQPDPTPAPAEEKPAQLGDKFRPVLQLNGKDDALIPTGITLKGAFTVEAWVKLNPSIDQNDSLGGSPGELEINFFDETPRVYGGNSLGDVIIAKKKITADLWTHVAVTCDAAGACKIYINGELDNTASKSIIKDKVIPNFQIGWSRTNQGTHGQFAEYRIWSRERSGDEIRAHFDRSVPAGDSALVFNGTNGQSWGKTTPAAELVRTLDLPPVMSAELAGLKPTPQPAQAPTQDSEAITISRAQEMANKLAREKEAERAAALAPPVVKPPPVRDFTPGDGEKMSLLKANGLASVTGVVLNVRPSNAGNSLYFEFSNPTNAKEIMAVAHKRDFKDDFNITAYKDLIGKNMRFDGTVFKEPGGKQYVKIRSREQMKVLP